MADSDDGYSESTYAPQPSTINEAAAPSVAVYNAAPPPIVAAPTPGVMVAPPPPQYAPNLLWLKGQKSLKIKQNVDLQEVLGCCEKANSYMIYAANGQHVADAKEKSGGCLRCLCRNHCEQARGFTMRVKSFSHGDSFQCQRKWKPCVSMGFPPCCMCCADQLKILSPDGSVFYGDCVERLAWWRKRYMVNDGTGQLTNLVWGPCFTCCCGDVIFTIYDHRKNLVGKIYKKWGGLVKELVSDADTFVVEFGQDDMTLQAKACIIGLTFLIDFMYFEDNEPKKVPVL